MTIKTPTENDVVLYNDTQNRNPVLVYGSLLEGLCNHPLIANSPQADFAGLFATGWVAPMVSLGSFPGVLEPVPQEQRSRTPHSNKYAYVRGELYFVDDEMLETMDHFEGHPTFYRRTPVWARCGKVQDDQSWASWLELQSRNEKGITWPAVWMYILQDTPDNCDLLAPLGDNGILYHDWRVQCRRAA